MEFFLERVRKGVVLGHLYLQNKFKEVFLRKYEFFCMIMTHFLDPHDKSYSDIMLAHQIHHNLAKST